LALLFGTCLTILRAFEGKMRKKPLTKKEIKKLTKEIAKRNGVRPSEIKIFVDKDGQYYDWSFK